MSAAETTAAPDAADEPEALVAIRRQFEEIRRIREEVLPAETRRLAQMIAATKDDPDPRVHPTAASRAMGTAKGYAHQLVSKLEAGDL